MTHRGRNSLTARLKPLLVAAGLILIAALNFLGMLSASPMRVDDKSTGPKEPEYDVASIKVDKAGDVTKRVRFFYTPDGLSAGNVTLQLLIRSAYNVSTFQIMGAPSWANSEEYDINAKMERAAADDLQKLSPDQRADERREMLQALLRSRFKLNVHWETREGSVYALLVGKSGPKFSESMPMGPDQRTLTMGGGKLIARGLPISILTKQLAQQLERPVIDKTGLVGKYDFTLQWQPEEFQLPASIDSGENQDRESTASPSPSESAQSIFTAIQEQLGLKMERQRGPIQVLVVEHVEKPSQD